MASLDFTNQDEFRILQLTDLHFTNADAEDKKTAELMLELLHRTEPDLTVLTGDTVYGTKNRELTSWVCDIMDSYAKPWTFCFGNHDTEEPHGGSRQEIFDHFLANSKYCIASDMHPDGPGVGDHRIDLNLNGKTPWSIYVIDSGDYMLEDKDYYDYVKPEQIAWMRDDLKNLSDETQVLVFLHIPLPEYDILFKANTFHGLALEAVCSPPLNSGLFSVLLESGRCRGVFCGHDHINNFYGELLGIALVYGQASGYGTYSTRGFKRGGRVITLDPKMARGFKSQIFYEDGSAGENQEMAVSVGGWLDFE